MSKTIPEVIEDFEQSEKKLNEEIKELGKEMLSESKKTSKPTAHLLNLMSKLKSKKLELIRIQESIQTMKKQQKSTNELLRLKQSTQTMKLQLNGKKGGKRGGKRGGKFSWFRSKKANTINTNKTIFHNNPLRKTYKKVLLRNKNTFKPSRHLVTKENLNAINAEHNQLENNRNERLRNRILRNRNAKSAKEAADAKLEENLNKLRRGNEDEPVYKSPEEKKELEELLAQLQRNHNLEEEAK